MMMFNKKYRSIAIMLCVFNCIIYAYAEEKQYVRDRDSIPVYHVNEIPDNLIKIDGKLDEPQWKSGSPITFRDLANDEIPLHRGNCKMLWDSSYLYISYYLLDPNIFASVMQSPDEGPEKPPVGETWARGKETEIMSNDPFVKFFLDPDGDGFHYIELHVNAANATADLILEKPYGPYAYMELGLLPKYKPSFYKYQNANWKCFLEGTKTAVHLDGTINNSSDFDHGWSIEIAIPWTTLQKYTSSFCPPANVKTWKAHVGRVFYTKKGTPRRYWTWPVFDVFDCHTPAQWGILNFDPIENQKAYAGKSRLYMYSKSKLAIKTQNRLFRRFDIIAFGNPQRINIADLKKMGVKQLFFQLNNSIILDENKNAVWKNKSIKDKTFASLEKFNIAGISLIPVTGVFYEKDFIKTEGFVDKQMLQKNRWSDKHKFRCFTSETTNTIKRLQFLIKELSIFENFKGICLDDEPGVVAGGCICDRCCKLFTATYKTEVPARQNYLNTKK